VLEKQRAAGQPPATEVSDSLEAIRRTSREALAELRTTLEVFREADGAEPRAPRPGLARLDDLVGALRQAGRRIELVRDPAGPGPLPAAVDQAAFRIIQEGLTNVVRHAGDAAATVRVSRTDGRLAVEVADDGPGGPVTEEGNGIRGMRERARAVGGTVTLAPRPSGGLLLHAELPLHPVPAPGSVG
jgi:signal transduction histidine kinase